MTGDGGLARKQVYQGYDAVDQVMLMDGDMGPVDAIDFGPDFALQYEMGAIGRLTAGLFGTAGTPATLVSGAYKHTFQWADSGSHFFTFACERPGKIWEVASAVPMGLNIKLANARLAGSLKLRGNTLINDSAVNTLTQMDALTYASRASRVHFLHGAFLMNTQAGGALAAPTDVIEVSDMEFDFARDYDAVHVAGATNISQPKEGKAPKITVKITIPRASATNLAYFDSFTAMTAFKMTAVFTGVIIGATAYYYSITFGFPRLKLTAPPAAPLEDIIKCALAFEAEEAAAAPTGMTYTRPYMEVQNAQATDYLT